MLPHYEKNSVYEIDLKSQEFKEISLDHPNKLTNRWTANEIVAQSNICVETNSIAVIYEGGKFGIFHRTTSVFDEIKQKSKDY